MRLSSGARCQCYLFFKLIAVTPSLMYLFVCMYVCRFDYTHDR